MAARFGDKTLFVSVCIMNALEGREDISEYQLMSYFTLISPHVLILLFLLDYPLFVSASSIRNMERN